MIEFLKPLSELPYDPKNKDSIVEFAKKLQNKSLRNRYGKTEEFKIEERKTHDGNKGKFGQLVEKLHFLIKNNSKRSADFTHVNMELKTAGAEYKKTKKLWVAPNALMLSAINFNSIVNEKYFESSVWEKNKSLLLIFYERKDNFSDTLQLDLNIKFIGAWSLNAIKEKDKVQIQKDWETIKEKVKNGKAHELSRGDTFYLEAAPSATSNSFTEQPYGPKCRTKKYGLKSRLVNTIIADISESYSEEEISLYDSPNEPKKISIEDKVFQKISPYLNKTNKQLIDELDIKNFNPESKQQFATISKNILKKIFEVPLGVKPEEYIDEFKKSGLVIRTIRLSENSVPKEDISFPAFKFRELINENWDESKFHSLIDKKFIFFFFQFKGKDLFLKKVKFWNMPYKDIQVAKKVWEEARKIIKKGNIIKEIKTNKRGAVTRYTNFPTKKFSSVAHVRTHAIDSFDTYPLPFKEKTTNAMEYTKHSFWLNADYVKKEIFLK
jgi:DNA mismatch repair protein MutH